MVCCKAPGRLSVITLVYMVSWELKLLKRKFPLKPIPIVLDSCLFNNEGRIVLYIDRHTSYVSLCKQNSPHALPNWLLNLSFELNPKTIEEFFFEFSSWCCAASRRAPLSCISLYPESSNVAIACHCSLKSMTSSGFMEQCYYACTIKLLWNFIENMLKGVNYCIIILEARLSKPT